MKKRENEGISLTINGHVQVIGSSKFIVKSATEEGKWYTVEWAAKRWVCSCEDFQKRRRKCKHIYAVCYFLTLRDVQAGVRKLGDKEKCPYCGMDDMVIKDGRSENRSGIQQRYYCKRCKRGFTARTGFEGMHGQSLAILLSLDLYYRGLSLRQIAEHLQSIYNIKVSHGTIYGWIKRYVKIISEYLNRLEVRTGERWHADDTVVRVKGKHMRLWGILDSETRLLIANHISIGKTAEEAYTLLDNGLQKSQSKPLELVTDGAGEYSKAVDELFSGDPIIHVQAGISTPLSNNKMERFFRSLKQRFKTINSFQSLENAETFIEGFQTYYNFIRTHRSLNGLTPAQAGGITDEKLSWMDLISLAAQHPQFQKSGGICQKKAKPSKDE